MSIDIGSLTNTMITGVRHAIGDRWSAIRALAEPELRKLAETLEDVQQLYASGRITADHAVQLVEMQRNTAISAVRTVEGLGVLTAREALDAAAHAAGAVVNRLVGFKLISATKEKPMAKEKEQEVPQQSTSKTPSQEPAKSSPTGRTKEGAVRPGSSTKSTSRPVKVQFKAGKDL
ncbi:MAG TPA: hypothetical protein VK648_08390 [Gemmatimonadaceae bacterium]|nr:MAG: hypothetical protein DMF56_24960 [Acidobacteriota bacterium]HTD83792.1 hypothetical protein [Gemmatimonadaceae bacterium]